MSRVRFLQAQFLVRHIYPLYEIVLVNRQKAVAPTRYDFLKELLTDK